MTGHHPIWNIFVLGETNPRGKARSRQAAVRKIIELRAKGFPAFMTRGEDFL